MTWRDLWLTVCELTVLMAWGVAIAVVILAADQAGGFVAAGLAGFLCLAGSLMAWPSLWEWWRWR